MCLAIGPSDSAELSPAVARPTLPLIAAPMALPREVTAPNAECVLPMWELSRPLTPPVDAHTCPHPSRPQGSGSSLSPPKQGLCITLGELTHAALLQKSASRVLGVPGHILGTY